MHGVADPERAEEEHVVPTCDRFARRVSRIRRRVAGPRQRLPSVAHREDEACGVVSQRAGPPQRERSRTERRRATRFHQAAGTAMHTLRGVDLAFERDNAIDLRRL